MNYVIAIPSYMRPDILNKKTLPMLKEYNIPKSKINIFVANKEESNIYKDILDKTTYNKIIIGKKGIKEIRNFMSQYFKEGQHIVYLDDDISKIWQCINTINPYDKTNNKLIKIKSLDTFLKKAFNLSKKTGYHNWSVYPRDNPYFMKPTTTQNPLNSYVTTDLRFLMGGFHGVINNKKAEIRTIGDKEDYERTIKYYLKDNGVIRYNNISCCTRVYNAKGGLQETQRIGESNKNAKILIKKYPTLVRINNGRKSDFVEIMLRDQTKLKSWNKSKKHNTKSRYNKSLKINH